MEKPDLPKKTNIRVVLQPESAMKTLHLVAVTDGQPKHAKARPEPKRKNKQREGEMKNKNKRTTYHHLTGLLSWTSARKIKDFPRNAANNEPREETANHSSQHCCQRARRLLQAQPSLSTYIKYIKSKTHFGTP